MAGYRLALPAAGLAPGETASLTVFNVGGPGGYQHISDRAGTVEVVAGSEDRVRNLLEVVTAALRVLAA